MLKKKSIRQYMFSIFIIFRHPSGRAEASFTSQADSFRFCDSFDYNYGV